MASHREWLFRLPSRSNREERKQLDRSEEHDWDQSRCLQMVLAIKFQFVAVKRTSKIATE
jgi:hypothetical protein